MHPAVSWVCGAVMRILGAVLGQLCPSQHLRVTFAEQPQEAASSCVLCPLRAQPPLAPRPGDILLPTL